MQPIKYDTLELRHYKRLHLSDIKHIKLSFDKPYQIILGTNGSGKSSLLKEISVLPAEQKQFSKGGSKIITLTANGSSYRLESLFEGKAEYYFYKDDVNLNDGRTITVQRELCRQEFGITPIIQQILLGNLKFTTMTPKQRREVFTLMSDTDLTYAFNQFKRTATLTRDNQGTIKYLKSRITSESDKLASLTTHETVLDDVELLKRELTVLMEHYRNDLPSVYDVQKEIDHYLESAEKLIERALNLKPIRRVGGYVVNSATELLETYETVKDEVNVLHARVDEISIRYSKLEELFGSLDDVGDIKYEDLKIKFDALIQKKNTLVQTISQFQFEGDIRDLKPSIGAIVNELIDILQSLPDNSEHQFTKGNLIKLDEEISTLRSNIHKVQSRLRSHETDIEHIRVAKETNCPKCGYVWKEGVSDHDLVTLEEKRNACIDYLKRSDERIATLLETKEKFNEYTIQFRRLKTLKYNHPKAVSIFNWLFDENRFFYQPNQLTQYVHTWAKEALVMCEVLDIERQLTTIEETKERIKVISQSTDIDSSKLGETLKVTKDQLESTTHEYITRREVLRELHTQVTRQRQLEDILQQVDVIRENVETKQEILSQSIQSDFCKKQIGDHQTHLAQLTNQLNEKVTIENLIDDLKASLTNVEKDFNIHRILTKALSPTDGIIAETMTEFIRVFVGQMNDVLSQLYTYPIEIQPCGIESNELDYKFPLLISEGSEVQEPDDVGEGSDGQKEAIDFTFKIIAMLYLNCQHHPLYVDEIGRAQDPQHLTNLMNYIKLTVESNRTPQLFMISHIAAGFGIFSLADVIVLSDSNIVTPPNYNENVEIEYL